MDSDSGNRDEIEPQIALFIPFFYRSSKNTSRDPAAAVARITKALRAKPVMADAISTDFPSFLFHVASFRPAHTDHILHTIKLLLEVPSLPPIDGCHWDRSRPNVPFAEMFDIVFTEDLINNVCGPIDVSEDRDSYIAGSLVSGRARSLGLFNSPETVGSLEEGLKLTSPQHSSVLDYQGEQAEIALVGSCLQLLGSASSLMQRRPWAFTREIILASLESAKSDRNDKLIQFTISHIQKEPITDLTSEEIVNGLKAVGWRFPSDTA